MSYKDDSLTRHDLVEIERLLDRKVREVKNDLFFLFLKIGGGAMILAMWGIAFWTFFGLK